MADETAKAAEMKSPDKPCTVCNLPKSQCRAKLGLKPYPSRTPDPRGLSSQAGIRTLDGSTLRAMASGRAGEGDVAELAAREIRRRDKLEAVHERTPLWALSPFEQGIGREKVKES